jgi:hypothetical protein
MLTFVIFVDAIVPVPPFTTHVSFTGGVMTDTAYWPPNAIGVGKVNMPFALTVVASPPLFERTSEALVDNPVTVPPTLYVGGGLAG